MIGALEPILNLCALLPKNYVSNSMKTTRKNLDDLLDMLLTRQNGNFSETFNEVVQSMLRSRLR
ncbi:MAG: hypothetical protein EBQ95_00740 [Gammaproteobacteria bacterium]|nr:hypothetical protein [Gammaproteobacteria bacterium]